MDEQTVGEAGWLCGTYRGNRGWFPQSYAEKCADPSTARVLPSSPGRTSGLPPPINSRWDAAQSLPIDSDWPPQSLDFIPHAGFPAPSHRAPAAAAVVDGGAPVVQSDSSQVRAAGWNLEF